MVCLPDKEVRFFSEAGVRERAKLDTQHLHRCAICSGAVRELQNVLTQPALRRVMDEFHRDLGPIMGPPASYEAEDSFMKAGPDNYAAMWPGIILLWKQHSCLHRKRAEGNLVSLAAVRTSKTMGMAS